MSETKERLRFLDNLRGFTIFLMIPINAAMEYNSIPFWFKHASSSGVLPADFIMPSFFVAGRTKTAFEIPNRNTFKWLLMVSNEIPLS